MMIRLEQVNKQYPNQEAPTLRDIYLEIQQGEFVALMGPSGCGKSTLLNIMGAMDNATTGSVRVDGLELTQQPDDLLTTFRRETVGFVFQFFNLLNTLSVKDNIALPLALLGNESPEAIARKTDEWLTYVNLSHRADAYPAQISGGEMQRTAIARALIHQPKLLLADEPTGNLDSENGQQILQLLKSLCETHGQTVVMATHSEESARQFAHRIVYIRDGRIIEDCQTGVKPEQDTQAS